MGLGLFGLHFCSTSTGITVMSPTPVCGKIPDGWIGLCALATSTVNYSDITIILSG